MHQNDHSFTAKCEVFTQNKSRRAPSPSDHPYSFLFPEASSRANILTRPDSRAGKSVVGGNRVVDVDEETGVSGRVSTGQGDLRAGAAVATVGDGDLTAGDVELSTILGAGAV